MSVQRLGEMPRARYAVDPARSRGRLFDEPPSAMRTPYQRDRDRVIHSTAFRRLKHKTQVFVYHEGDHFRTRLTHSIEVAQIARSLARELAADEDLAEALALAHDLGHTPFGHAGEDTLNDCMADYGGFDHNAQSLRIVTRLERRYAEFDGLNLTWETLEGLVKHNGPLTDAEGTPVGRYAGRDLPHAIRSYQPFQDLQLWSWPGIEAQIAAIADDIAYDAHDIDDGLRAGLFTPDDVADVPLVGEILTGVRRRYPGLETSRLVHETVRRLIGRFVRDVLDETHYRLRHNGIDSAEDVRGLSMPVVAFSERMTDAEGQIKAFLYERMYRHADVMETRRAASGLIRDLFAIFLDQPENMPEPWSIGLAEENVKKRARRVCDYIAGMTDRYAWREHQRLFDDTPELR